MQDKDFLSYFDNLGKNPDDKTIVENSEKILKTLLTVEHQAPNKANEYDSFLGQLVSEDLEYTITRLLRGTSSDDFRNKIGFSTSLLSVLRTFKHVQPDKYIAYTQKEMSVSNAITKGERSHFVASKLIGLFCLVISGRIEQLPNSLDVYTTIYNGFVKSLKDAPWCGQLVLALIERSIEDSEASLASKKLNIITKSFKSQLKAAVSEFNLDIFALLVYAARKQVEFGGEKQSTLHDAINTILGDQTHLTKVFQAAMTIYPEKHIGLRFLAQYLTRMQTHKQQEQFWKLVSLIAKDPNIMGIDKKPKYQFYFVVLTLFKYWIKEEKLSAKVFAQVVNNELFEIWMRQTRVLNKSLHQVAKKIEQNLSTKIVQLLQEGGELTPLQFLIKIKETRAYHFDSKNPMAKVLLGALNEEDSLAYVNQLIKWFKEEKESFQFYLTELQVLFELNYKQISDKNVLKICQFLLETHLTFEFDGPVEGNEEEGLTPEAARKALTQGVKDESFTKLNSIITKLLKKPSEKFEGKKNHLYLGISSTGEVWTYRILKLLVKPCKDLDLPYAEIVKKTLKCLEDLQGEIQGHLKEASTKETEETDDKAQETSRKYLALSLLISATALQLLSHEDVEDNINELIHCATKLKEKNDALEQGDTVSKKKKVAGKKTKKIQKEEEEVNEEVDVLIDVMISMLTRCPGYLREAIERTFEQFANEVGDFALGNLVGVITRKDEEYLVDMKDDETNELAALIESVKADNENGMEEEVEGEGDAIEEEEDEDDE